MVTFKCGDLVTYSKGYKNGVPVYSESASIIWWCRVLDIVVNKESYNQYDIITGRGDENTKAIFKLRPLGLSHGSHWDFSCKIEALNESDFNTGRTHDIHLIDTNYFQKEYSKYIQIAQDKMDFINRNRNRDEKLDDILKV